MGRRARWIAGLGAAAVVLVVACVVTVVRHNDDIAARERQTNEQRARYARELRRVEATPPRFQVSYGEISLEDYKALGYDVAPTAVAHRISSGRPRIRPDFGALPAPGPYVGLQHAFREGRVRTAQLWVVALVVTQVTPGSVERVDLRARSVRAEPYRSVFDPLDFLELGSTEAAREVRVAWKPRGEGGTAVFPLGVLHRFSVRSADFNDRHHQVADDVVLVPRGLVVSRGGRHTTLSIRNALNSPVVLDPAPAS